MKFQESELIYLKGEEITISISKRAKRADALANQKLILQTAKRLFNQYGVNEVNMANVAKKAGVGRGTLYRAFPNKGELCLALMDDDLREFQDETLQQFRSKGDQPFLKHLEQFLDRLIHFLDQHTTLMCEAQGYEILDSKVNHTALHSWFHQTVDLLLKKAQQNQEMRPEVDRDYLADAILAPLNPNLFAYQRKVMNFSLEKISQELCHLILDGIRLKE